MRNEIGWLLSRISVLTLVLVASHFIVVLFLLKLIRQSTLAEREAADSRNQLQEIISTSIDGVLTVGIDGRIIDYNGAAERIFGYRRDETIGCDMADLIVPEHLRPAHDEGMARYRRTREKRVVGAGLFRLEAKRKSGEIFPVELSISAANAKDGQVFVSFIRDISDRVAAEKELIEARDKAVAGERAKANLLAVMSHEMRTPLNGITGTLELLQSSDIPDEQKRYLSAMETSAKLIMHHVDDVLMVSRADAGKLEFKFDKLSVPQFLCELVESQRQSIESNGNRISCDTRNSPETIWTDSIRLGQIILNLVGNADKFTEYGEITVECERLPGGKWVEFRITDTGIGITPEDLDSVFEDFRTLDSSYRRRTGGSGLGLSITRRLVEGMGGQIGLESEVDTGTLVWVRLPMDAPDAEIALSDRHSGGEKTDDEESPETTPRRLLLVEDNEINRLVATKMLEMDGHETDVATNGSEAVELASANAYDLILMDISMPKMDGIEATQLIRSRTGPNRETPILALTAHALPEDLERFKEAGISDTLLKPLSREKLSRSLARKRPRPLAETRTDVISILAGQKGKMAASALVDEFISDANALFEGLASGTLEADVRSELASRAHKCAGSASVLGVEEFCGQLRALEDILRNEGVGLSDHARQMRGTWPKTRKALATRKAAVMDG